MAGGSSSSAEGEPLLESSNTGRRTLRASWTGAGGGGIFIVQRDGSLEGLAPYWWVFFLRGFVMIAFGLFCLLYPGMTVRFLTTVFGAFMFLDGMACLAKFFGNFRRRTTYWPTVVYLLNACCDVVIGVYAFVRPEVTAVLLLIFVAAWFVATGVFEIALACQMRREIHDGAEWYMGLGGILSLLFGVLILKDPTVGAIAFTSLIGVVALIFGWQLIYVGNNLKTLNTLLQLSGEGEEAQSSNPVNVTIDVV